MSEWSRMIYRVLLRTIVRTYSLYIIQFLPISIERFHSFLGHRPTRTPQTDTTLKHRYTSWSRVKSVLQTSRSRHSYPSVEVCKRRVRVTDLCPRCRCITRRLELLSLYKMQTRSRRGSRRDGITDTKKRNTLSRQDRKCRLERNHQTEQHSSIRLWHERQSSCHDHRVPVCDFASRARCSCRTHIQKF